MGRTSGSWLSGPNAAIEDGVEIPYKGFGVGLPESGPGSVASTFKRLAALFVDWILSGLIAGGIVGFTGHSLGSVTLFVWLVEGVVFLAAFNFTPGQLALGLRVSRVEPDVVRVGMVRAIVRGVLIIFMIPPLVQDLDGRGMHDRATGTVLVRWR